MPKYIIVWNAGHGDTSQVIEVECLDTAEKWAYDEWRQEAESAAIYTAMEYTDELADEYGL